MKTLVVGGVEVPFKPIVESVDDVASLEPQFVLWGEARHPANAVRRAFEDRRVLVEREQAVIQALGCSRRAGSSCRGRRHT